MKRTLDRIICILGLTALGSVSCSDETATVDYAYEDAYYYDAYYPADVAYSSYYWTDAWAYNDFYYLVAFGGAQVTTGVGGSSGSDAGLTARQAIGDTIRSLARGESVCPNQITVTPKEGPRACAVGTSTTARNGVTIVFNACQLPNGAQLDGTVDVTATRTASEPTCSATTTITINHTTTFTNLAYTNTSGGKIVFPNETASGSNTFGFGVRPTALTTNLDGRIQIYGSGGTLISDHNHQGTLTFTPSGDRTSYAVDGTLNIQDQRASVSSVLTIAGLTRTASCCRPTAGTVTINRSGGTFPGTRTWTFGPSCGSVSVNGNSTTLPACI